MGDLSGLTEVGDGRLIKMEIDYAEQAQKVISEAKEKAQRGKLTEALEQLISLEKTTRLGCDAKSNAEIQKAIVNVCWESQDLDALNENIVALSKKRSLLKMPICKMIQECCSYVDLLTDETKKHRLIQTLRTVTAGKIYVEVERARLSYKLAMIQEAKGETEEAAQVLLDLQVETFGTMDKKEKVEMLLEQMRLCLLRKDFLRAQIVSRKISVKYFQDSATEVQQLKLKFYQQMMELDQEEGKYLDICRHWGQVYNTQLVQNDPLKLEEALKNQVLFVLLAPHDNEQSDLMHRIKADRNLERIAAYKELLILFITEELMSWKEDVVGKYESVLRQGTRGSPATGVFDPKNDLGVKQWNDLQTRVGEHNIRMIAKYYTRIDLNRMAELLDWPIEKTEEFVCQLVTDGVISYAKIDRPAQVVEFRKAPNPVEVLDSWASDLTTLMQRLNQASHLIAKEQMIHKHLHVKR